MCLFYKITADLNSRSILMETKFISDLPEIKSLNLKWERMLSGFSMDFPILSYKKYNRSLLKLCVF